MSPGNYAVQLEMVEEYLEFFGPVASAQVQVVPRPNRAQAWEWYE